MADKILVVDDDLEFRNELHQALDCYRIVEAADGKEAMQILRKPNDIDVVLLDVMMPGLNGTDVLRQMKRLSPALAIVILTGYSSKDVAVEALKGHADEYIEKPLDIEKTKEIIERLLQEKRTGKDGCACICEDKIEKVKRFVKRNFQKKVTLKDAAEAVFLSPKYLSRVFKERTHIGFNEYKLRCMLSRSKELLARTGLTVNQISDQIGYQNAESFIRIFEKLTGVTPSGYRRQCLIRKRKPRKTTPKTKKSKSQTRGLKA